MYVTLSSEYIENYIYEHKVESYQRPGRISVRTPSLEMYEYYVLLEQSGKLFDQEQYWQHLVETWGAWFTDQDVSTQESLRLRAFHHFYRSGVDQTYCQALLAETKLFNLIGYNAALETLGVDLFCETRLERRLEIACQVDTDRADSHHNNNDGLIVIRKKLDGRRIGGMPFYRKADLAPIIRIGQQDWLDHQDWLIYGRAS